MMYIYREGSTTISENLSTSKWMEVGGFPCHTHTYILIQENLVNTFMKSLRLTMSLSMLEKELENVYLLI